MKINELTNEAPFGGMNLAAKQIGSRVLNKIPSQRAKSKAANMAGQADLMATANNLEKEFNAWLGTQQKTMKGATGYDLLAFLKTKNVKPKDPIPGGVLQPAQLNPILVQVAKDAMAGQNKPAGDEQPAEPEQGKDAQQPQLDPKLKAELDKLSPEEKQKLVSML